AARRGRLRSAGRFHRASHRVARAEPPSPVAHRDARQSGPAVTSMSGFAEIDISEWTPEGFEPLGTKPKMWMVDPATQQAWLFKTTTSNVRADGTAYLKGDDWAERVATEVAVQLGVPAAMTELAVVDLGDDSSFGV